MAEGTRRTRRTTGRDTVLRAGAEALRDRGIAHVRLADIADAAGISSPGVLYHFPDMFALFDDAFEQSVRQYCQTRWETVAAVGGAEDRLRACIASGVPATPAMLEATRLLIELQPYVLREPGQRARWEAFIDEQIAIYVTALDQGAADGVFSPTSPTRDIARDLVALEDGYSASLLAGFVSAEDVRARLLAFAGAACGIALPPA